MAWEACTHGIARDHMAVIADEEGRAVWRCSRCGAEGRWRQGWRYHGNVECKRCLRAVVDRVECPACSAKQENTRGAHADAR
jgi:DNA-directed RNA polymerase subunit RPC12/RpoP